MDKCLFVVPDTFKVGGTTMFETYEEALHWIHSRLRLGIKPGLMRMEWMLEKLDHPEQKVKFVHIGGTNGKGSTVTYVRSILEKAGYETGTFTSPYIEQFNERISLNGSPITDEEIILLANVIYPLSVELESTELGGPSEFEIITAMAIYYFAEVILLMSLFLKLDLVDVWIQRMSFNHYYPSSQILD